MLNHCKAVDSRHQQIQQNNIKGSLAQGSDGFLAIGGRLAEPAITPEQRFEESAGLDFVIDNQDACHNAMQKTAVTRTSDAKRVTRFSRAGVPNG